MATTKSPAEEALDRLLPLARSGDASIVPDLVALLPAPRVGRHAALALALLGRRELVPELIARLGSLDGLTKVGFEGMDAVGFIAALEVMDDPSAVPALRALLDRPGFVHAWDVHHAIWRLTGREPLVPLTAGWRERERAIAAAWRSFDLDAPRSPRLEAVRIDDDRAVSFELHDGAGQLCLEFDPPTPGSTWTRWNLSLHAGRQPLYAVGSHCDTCETTLVQTGLAPAGALAAADSLRPLLADLSRLDASVLERLLPAIERLRTGHHAAWLVDLPLERVTAPGRSWLTRRSELRQGDEDDRESCTDWPGVEHFQVPTPVAGELPTYGLVVPLAPLDALDPATIAGHRQRILDGHRPAALAMAWVETKHVRGVSSERFVLAALLDGHHRLAAYAGLGVPARLLVIGRLEDSGGPADDRSAWLREGLRALAATAPAG